MHKVESYRANDSSVMRSKKYEARKFRNIWNNYNSKYCQLIENRATLMNIYIKEIFLCNNASRSL